MDVENTHQKHKFTKKKKFTKNTKIHTQNTKYTQKYTQQSQTQDLRMLMTRESPTIVPQYYFMQFTQGGTHREEQRISNFPHPYPTVSVCDVLCDAYMNV